jgi:hypothetical protein
MTMRDLDSLKLFRTLIVVFVALSLALTFFAIEARVPYRFGGSGARDDVAADAFAHGTGISAPLVFLIAFVGLLGLTWVPGRWKALPLMLAAVAGVIGLIAGVAEIPLGSGPFAYPVGVLPVALWLLSMAALIGIVISGVVAGISAVRDPPRNRLT